MKEANGENPSRKTRIYWVRKIRHNLDNIERVKGPGWQQVVEQQAKALNE
jgi:hypothetical protein